MTSILAFGRDPPVCGSIPIESAESEKSKKNRLSLTGQGGKAPDYTLMALQQRIEEIRSSSGYSGYGKALPFSCYRISG